MEAVYFGATVSKSYDQSLKIYQNVTRKTDILQAISIQLLSASYPLAELG